MKKLISLMLTIILVFSMGITAFAANTGSITITNTTPDREYSVYKLFNATYNAAKDSVAYSLDEGTTLYAKLFDTNGNPTAENDYFVLNATKNIVKAEGVSDDEVYTYVASLITSAGLTPVDTKTPAAGATSVTFTDLPYGYYVVKSSLGAAVTITSNTPDAQVIDKNQSPAVQGNFTKQVWDKNLLVGGQYGGWSTSNTAAVGDIVKYKVSFSGQNYDGQEKIQYYTINDEKGSALWVEFGTDDARYLMNNIKVTVGGEVLTRGCYLPIGDVASTNQEDWEWDYMGDWGSVTKNRNNAQWYLLHEDYDKFRFVIPWMSDYTVNGGQTTAYSFSFGQDATFLYDTGDLVTIEYCASVEPNVVVGGGADKNLYNKAQLNWTCAKSSGSTDWKTVHTDVFGLALRKIDSVDLNALAGAEFAIFTDADCKNPLYVIPTDIAGVYIKDDLNAVGQQITGTNKLTAREKYAANLSAYLGTATQKNIVTSPVNGKIVILGLDKGTYYLKETKAPNGYNPLTASFALTAGLDMRDFHVYADENGTVADLQAASGEFKDNNYHVTYRDVSNSQGEELPSTGGMGTMLLITIGALAAMAFAVLLITHKKMTIYRD